MAPFRSRRQRHYSARPLVAFLLVASFGVLFVGCGGSDPNEEEFSFTEDDLAEFQELAADSGSGAGADDLPYLLPLPSGSGSVGGEIVLDLSKVSQYSALRAGSADGKNIYRVTNDFVNVRSAPNSQGATTGRFERGEAVTVTAFPNASWAEIQMPDGAKGYVSLQYIARTTSDAQLAAEKKQFEGQYYVNFAFVNLRKSPDQSSEKVGEIPGQTIVKPSAIQNGWATVTHNGQTGYVSEGYLAPFTPSFQVRQETFELPILQYRLDATNATALLQTLPTHVKQMQDRGYRFITLKGFADLLAQQEQRDVRLDPKTAVVIVTGITSDNVNAVSDTLNAAGIDATLFIATSHLGLADITEKTLLTLRANGFELGSAGHTGDDFRALTNAQATLELQQSRKLLEERGQTAVLAIAFPAGGVNDRIAQLAAEAGYLFGIGGGSSRTFTRKELLSLPSIQIFPTMTAEEVVSLATGGQ